MDITDLIIAYECGELGGLKTLELFQELLKTGQAWTLQGHYGRTASALIANDIFNRMGDFTDNGTDIYNQLLESEA